MSYIKFTKIDNAKLDSFKADLKALRSFSPVPGHLHDVLQRRTFHASFHAAAEGDALAEEIYLVMVSCHKDNVLMEAGKNFGMPRGLPILWQPGKVVHSFGFYPKFENDKLMADVDDEFSGVISLRMNRKYSGFLGQVIAFQISGQLFWTTCAKNSSGNAYADDAARIMHPCMTDSLVRRMVAEGFHVCGEVLSFADQKHGSRVLRECLIVTLVAYNHCLELGVGPTSPNNTNQFLKVFTFEEAHRLCLEYSLSVDDYVAAQTAEESNVLFRSLAMRRNLMDEQSLRSCLEGLGGRSLIRGNTRHDEVLGNVLEGVIIVMRRVDGTSKTVKYKFPMYTMRTMLVREYLERNHCVIDPVTFRSAAVDFVQRWVVDVESQRGYWFRLLNTMIDRYPQLREAYEASKPPHDEHIFVSDLVITTFPEAVFDPSLDYHALTNYAIKSLGAGEPNEIVEIVVVLGPIGSGKSSLATALCRSLPRAFHVDGDVLGLDTPTVLVLGEERPPLTAWRIADTVLRGLTPVVSHGGGFLQARNGTDAPLDFFDRMMTNLSCVRAVRVTLFLPTPRAAAHEVRIVPHDEVDSVLTAAESLYSETAHLPALVARRGWEITAEKLSERNRHNAGYPRRLVQELRRKDQLTAVVEFPAYRHDGHVFPDFSSILPCNNSKIASWRTSYEQNRLLCRVLGMYRPVTVAYSKGKHLEAALQNDRFVGTTLQCRIGVFPSRQALTYVQDALGLDAVPESAMDVEPNPFRILARMFESSTFKDDFVRHTQQCKAALMKNFPERREELKEKLRYDAVANKEDWCIVLVTFPPECPLREVCPPTASLLLHWGGHERQSVRAIVRTLLEASPQPFPNPTVSIGKKGGRALTEYVLRIPESGEGIFWGNVAVDVVANYFC